jgi:D-beta-D-heptose 7-phosphate kinase/D-beta-D-heptose 1-phosphate adenosyltransferase
MDAAGPNPKIVSRQQLIAIRRQLREQGSKAVFTNGCFDLLHRGHLELLRQARSLGDSLLVGLNSDASARRLKGPGRPLMCAADRVVLLAEMESVTYVCVFDEDSVEGLVRELLPDVLVKGGDYRLEEVVGRRWVEQAGGCVRTTALWPGDSTSALLEKIRNLPA